jgi:hypothetical protein
MHRHRATLAALAVVPVVLLAACGDDDSAQRSPESTQSPPTTAPAPPTSTAPTTTDVGIAEGFESFEYYGACGNEAVEVGGTMFFPVLPDRQGEIDEDSYPPPGDGTEGSDSTAADTDDTRQGVTRVAPPGPGDDIGTMTVHTDGFARFESESGWIIWLTDEEQTYNWVC